MTANAAMFNQSKPIILFVSAVHPYPPYGGDRIRCYNLIDSLCQNFNVVVLAPKTSSKCELIKKVHDWYALPKHTNLPILKERSNAYYLLMEDPVWNKCLKSVCQKYQPKVAWFEYGYWGQYVPIVRGFGTCTILGTQNIQSELTKQQLNSTLSGLKYLSNWVYHQTEFLHEHTMFRRFDRIVSVSESDQQYHSKFVVSSHSKLVPNYINEACYKNKNQAKAVQDNIVIFTANFNNFQNKIGTNWLVREVWPIVRQKISSASLYLVGHHSENIFPKTKKPVGVTCISKVSSIVPHLQRAKVAVVPIFHGSGTRLKVLEALACSIPIVSTTLGVEGIKVIPGQSVLIADSSESFAQSIIELLSNNIKRERLSQNGLSVLINDYSFEVNTNRIQKIVDELIC